MASISITESQAPPVVKMKAPDARTKQSVRDIQASLMSRISGAVFAGQGTESSGTPGDDDDGLSIPLIDIGPSFGGDAAAKASVAAALGRACRDVGFFQIANHNVGPEAMSGIMEQARRFFHELPAEKKEALHIRNSPLMRGYEPSDASNVNPADWKEGDEASKETKNAFNWGYEPLLDPTGGDGKYVELDLQRYPNGANVWPSEQDLPGFFAGVQAYHREVVALARHLAGLFALSLGLPETHFDPMMTHPGTIARMIHYPPQKPRTAKDQEEQDLGLGAHTDYECFTLLISDSPGLEVLAPTPDAAGRPRWIAVPERPGVVTVNVADFFSFWTNGQYRSAVHRVVNRSADRERYSVPMFFSVNYDETVSVLPTCVAEGGEKPKFEDVQAGPYILERVRATLKEAAADYK